jgi:hypothetical protein
MDSIRAGCLPAIDRRLKRLAAQDKYFAPRDVQFSPEDIRAQLIARLEMSAREPHSRSKEPPEQIPPSKAETTPSTAPGERADIAAPRARPHKPLKKQETAVESFRLTPRNAANSTLPRLKTPP